MQDEQLTANFHLSELIRSDVATRKGIDNTPPAAVLTTLRTVLAPGLQRIRDHLQASVHVSSGYRCPELNHAVGGSQTSQHMQGEAADVTCPSVGTPLEVCRILDAAKVELGIDQLILEGNDWIHVSFTAGQPRHSVLTAHFDNGKATYTTGLPA